jgi:hypothetical protein
MSEKSKHRAHPKLPIENYHQAKVLDLVTNYHDSECTRWVVWFGGPPPTRAFDATLIFD